MACHHGEVGAPFLFKTYQYAHANRVYAGLAHAVETVDAPFKLRLHATWVVKFVVFAVVGLLKAYHAIHAVVGQFFVVLGTEWHYLNFKI